MKCLIRKSGLNWIIFSVIIIGKIIYRVVISIHTSFRFCRNHKIEPKIVHDRYTFFAKFWKQKKILQISFRIRKWIVIQHNQLLVPETYETPPPECSSGGGLSGMTFINFLMSAIAVGANLISNINSNQNNNNNNNNDNNDNVANFNFVNNNNGGNNQNTIQICKYSSK